MILYLHTIIYYFAQFQKSYRLLNLDVKLYNEARSHPMIVIGANAITFKFPDGMNPEKYAHDIAECLARDSVGSIMFVDNEVCCHDTKRVTVKRRIDQESNKVILLEKKLCLLYLFDILLAIDPSHNSLVQKLGHLKIN